MIDTLDKRCLIKTHKTRDQQGRFKSTTYVPALTPRATTVKNSGDRFCRRRKKPASNVRYPSHEALSSGPRRESPSTEKSYAPPASPAAALPLSCSGAEILRDAALQSDRLPGWAIQCDRPDEGDSFFDVDVDTVEAVLPDEELVELIWSATGGRVHPEILSPVGLYAIRHLAAFVRHQARLERDEELAAQTALMLAIKPICGIRDPRRVAKLSQGGRPAPCRRNS